jgi:F0F1-type ATP synthase assembly protein I
MKNEGDANGWARGLKAAAPYMGIGMSLAVTLLIGLGVGYWADRKLGTAPVFFLGGGVLGLSAALYEFFKTVSRKP